MKSCNEFVRGFRNDEEAQRVGDNTDFYQSYATIEYEPYPTPQSKYPTLPPYSPIRNSLHSPESLPSPRSLFGSQEQKDSLPVASINPYDTRYLNGMRGLAAFAVFLCHLSYGTWDIGHVYGAAESGQSSTYTCLLQLPIIRLFYSGPPMVAIFFVISGYALSYKPIHLMQSRNAGSLLATLSSSVFRRALRLFLPCFVSTFIMACLAQLGIYKLTEEFAHHMRGVYEQHPSTAPDVMTQLIEWFYKMIDFVNVFDWQIYSASVDLDVHLWTIPVEMRCSMALFLTHILVSRMSTKLRILTILFLMVWGTYWNRCELVPFLAGAVIAELDLTKISKIRFVDTSDIKESNTMDKFHSFFWKCLSYLTFATGLFLASYPDLDGHITPGYVKLTKMIPDRYTEKHRFWVNIGAIMIVWSASNIDLLRQLLTNRCIQRLGKVSFPLYILHGPIIHTFGYFVMDKIWSIMGVYDDDSNLGKGFLLAATLIVVVTLWTSTIFLSIVDKPCVRFARWLENKFFTH